MSVEEKLASLKDRERWDIEKRRDELDRIYKVVPDMVTHTAKLTGIEPEVLIQLCYETGWHIDKPWHHVLSIMQSFYTSKNRIETEGK